MVSRCASATEVQEGSAVAVAQGAVEKEICSGVNCHQEVEDVSTDPENVIAASLGYGLVEGGVDEDQGGGTLAEEEEDGHDDEHNGDTILTDLLATSVSHEESPLMGTPVNVEDEEDVENEKKSQRDQDKHGRREPIESLPISAIVSQQGDSFRIEQPARMKFIRKTRETKSRKQSSFRPKITQ